ARSFVVHTRQAKLEHGTFAGNAARRDVAIHQDGEFARNREAKPRTAIGARRRTIDLTKFVEDVIQIAGRNSNAGVRNGDQDLFLFAYGTQYFRGDRDFAVLGELRRVVDQIHDDLMQPERIGVNHADVGGNIKDNPVIVRLHQRLRLALDVFEER